MSLPNLPDTPTDTDEDQPIHEARLWRDNGWTARVIKNEDDDGWAVAMTRAGTSSNCTPRCTRASR